LLLSPKKRDTLTATISDAD